MTPIRMIVVRFDDDDAAERFDALSELVVSKCDAAINSAIDPDDKHYYGADVIGVMGGRQ